MGRKLIERVTCDRCGKAVDFDAEEVGSDSECYQHFEESGRVPTGWTKRKSVSNWEICCDECVRPAR